MSIREVEKFIGLPSVLKAEKLTYIAESEHACLRLENGQLAIVDVKYLIQEVEKLKKLVRLD